ncbi:MAG: uracil-DNA glycosylase [Gammaproteobacteria bacterium]|nr:uracil-DNA glycosylase [Gammaproteobacteria bacterium]
MHWATFLSQEQQRPYFASILQFLEQERAAGKTIYPASNSIFNAIDCTPFADLKVVIIGQDPYHNPSQAHGLSFSVPEGIKPPPSLMNIFKELNNDLNIPMPKHGCLQNWANQGVLLLNSVLTVEENRPGSHANIGWQQFTDNVIQQINHHPEKIIYLLWGSYAQKKAALIDQNKHIILMAPHPSPLSVYRGFSGCGHFSKVNKLLIESGRTPINWGLE